MIACIAYLSGFDETCANNPSLTSLKVRQIISKLIEDRLGENLDLTSDEAVSDLSSLSDESSEQKSLEEQIAQAVIARVSKPSSVFGTFL